MTTDAELTALVRQGYQELADLLEGFRVERWDEPSLCEGWRVREVVAHMTMPVRYDQAAFMAELEAAGYDFTKLSNTVAARDSSLPTETFVAQLRDGTMASWTPPEGGAMGALSHLVIHGLDVTVALDVPRPFPDESVVTILDELTEGGKNVHFGTDLEGCAFEATDLDWRFGTGPAQRAPADRILVHLCGRRVPGL